MFEPAAGWRAFINGQRGEVFVELIIGDQLGQAFKVQTDRRNAAKVIAKGALALSPESYLLIKRFTYFFKTRNGGACLLDNGG